MWVVHLLISLGMALLLFLASRDAILLALYGKYTQGTVAAAPSSPKEQLGVVQFSGIRYDGHYSAISLPHPAPLGFGFDVVYLPNDPTVVAFAKPGDSPLLLITRSIGFLPVLLLSGGMTYFFFRGLGGASAYFSPPQAGGPPSGPVPVPPHAHAASGDVWNGDLSQLPRHDVPEPQPTIPYPGVVPVSLQPGESPELEQSALRNPAVPFTDPRHIPLQPEEQQTRDKSEDDARS
jgi:hypothetical protein